MLTEVKWSNNIIFFPPNLWSTVLLSLFVCFSGLNWTDLWAHSIDIYPSTDIFISSLRTDLKEHRLLWCNHPWSTESYGLHSVVQRGSTAFFVSNTPAMASWCMVQQRAWATSLHFPLLQCYLDCLLASHNILWFSETYLQKHAGLKLVLNLWQKCHNKE